MSDNPARVVIFDTTLRDGEQAPGFTMDVPAKVEMARALDALGVDIIEAGFPIASPADAEAVSEVSKHVRRPVIAALARCRTEDIQEAARALVSAERRRIHTFIATSDLHLNRKLRITREACLEAAVAAVRLARQFTDDVEFSAEDATRSDRDFLCRVIEAVVREGCRTVNLPDTVGYATPDETRSFFEDIRTRVPNADQTIFSAHCHDDLGLAVANSLAAIQGGVRQVECTINGIGERAGNASVEEIVMALRVRSDRLPYTTDIQTTALYETSQLLTRLTSEPVQANKAIVGRNAFAHEAGIHQDGVLKDPTTYDHASAGRRPAVGPARSGPSFRPARRAAAMRDTGLGIDTRRARTRLPRGHLARREPESRRRRRPQTNRRTHPYDFERGIGRDFQQRRR
jgi:2-isopropylmalate synthase